MPLPRMSNYAKNELQIKTFSFSVSSGNGTRDLWICRPMPYPLDHGGEPWAFKAKINISLSSLFPGPSHLFKMASAFQSKLKVFTARFCYVSHGNATITCYEETFRELGTVKLSTSANRKPLRYENKPRAGASSIVACLVLTEFRRMF